MAHYRAPVALAIAASLALSLGACRDLAGPDRIGGAVMVAVESVTRANPGDSLTIAVRVVDQFGRGVSGIAVDWAVLTGGGEITPVAPTTDSSGLAQAIWALGMAEGTQSARATAAGLTGVDFVVDTSPLIPD
jgi:hypothetical protein